MPFSLRNPHLSDPRLVQRCLDGDQSAWNELVTRYGRLIYSVPRRYGLSEQDASDVMQNVLVIVLKNLRHLRQQDHLSAWLVTIAHHETLRCQQRGGREILGEWEFPDSMPPLNNTLREITSKEILRQALERLAPTERQVVTALLADPPPSYDELAATLKIPRGSIGYWRKRALDRLKKELTELGFYS